MAGWDPAIWIRKIMHCDGALWKTMYYSALQYNAFCTGLCSAVCYLVWLVQWHLVVSVSYPKQDSTFISHGNNSFTQSHQIKSNPNHQCSDISTYTKKNPPYGRHWISRPMRIVAPISWFFFRILFSAGVPPFFVVWCLTFKFFPCTAWHLFLYYMTCYSRSTWHFIPVLHYILSLYYLTF